jgi:hypothetical protein
LRRTFPRIREPIDRERHFSLGEIGKASDIVKPRPGTSLPSRLRLPHEKE